MPIGTARRRRPFRPAVLLSGPLTLTMQSRAPLEALMTWRGALAVGLVLACGAPAGPRASALAPPADRAQTRGTALAPGDLERYLPTRAGRFTRGALTPEQIPEASDAFSASYRAADGVTVNVSFIVFDTAEFSRSILDANVQNVTAKGYRETERVRLSNQTGETGVLVVVRERDEAVFWTNRRIFAMARGPHAVTRELYDALPF